ADPSDADFAAGRSDPDGERSGREGRVPARGDVRTRRAVHALRGVDDAGARAGELAGPESVRRAGVAAEKGPVAHLGERNGGAYACSGRDGARVDRAAPAQRRAAIERARDTRVAASGASGASDDSPASSDARASGDARNAGDARDDGDARVSCLPRVSGRPRAGPVPATPDSESERGKAATNEGRPVVRHAGTGLQPAFPGWNLRESAASPRADRPRHDIRVRIGALRLELDRLARTVDLEREALD